MSRSSVELMGVPDELYHWMPGEMVVIVRLPRLPVGDAQDMLVEQVRTLLNEFLAQYNIILEPYGTYGRWRETSTMPPVHRQSFIFGLHRKQPLIAIFFHTRYMDASIQDPLPMALSYLQGHLEHLAQIGLHLVSAMPNWLVTAAPLCYGEGGPAIPPHPAPVLDVTATGNSLLGWRVNVLDHSFPLDSGALKMWWLRCWIPLSRLIASVAPPAGQNCAETGCCNACQATCVARMAPLSSNTTVILLPATFVPGAIIRTIGATILCLITALQLQDWCEMLRRALASGSCAF